MYRPFLFISFHNFFSYLSTFLFPFLFSAFRPSAFFALYFIFQNTLFIFLICTFPRFLFDSPCLSTIYFTVLVCQPLPSTVLVCQLFLLTVLVVRFLYSLCPSTAPLTARICQPLPLTALVCQLFPFSVLV
jgi:hypothetical protein